MLPRQHRRLDPVPDLQLLQNRRHVVLHGLFLQFQRLADFAVALALRHQLQNILLALAQVIQRVRGHRRIAPPHRHQQPPRQPRRDIRPPRRQFAHQLNQFARTNALQDIALRPQLDRLHQIVIGFRCRQHRHPGRGVHLHDPRQRANPAALGHRNVQQHHIRALAQHHLRRGLAVAGLAHHLNIPGVRQRPHQTVAVDRMVVGQHDPDHIAHSTPLRSITIASSVPRTPSRRLRKFNCPPRLSTRPASPASPSP